MVIYGRAGRGHDLTLKEGSTFSPSPSSMVFTPPSVPPVSGGTETSGSGDVTALRCSEPLRSKVGGPKRSSPCFAGWDRLTIACLVGLLFLFLIAVSLCTGRRSNEEYCFILLLIGLHLGRYPSEAVCSKMELTSLVSASFHP